MSKCEKNQETLLAMLRRQGRLAVGEAVSVLNISEATARRYFAALERAGRLIRVHGGVCLPGGGDDYVFRDQEVTSVVEKHAIGRFAASLITGGSRVFFDSGTTVRACGNALAERWHEAGLHDINIVTNSLVYDPELARLCNIILTGGTVRPRRMDLAGAEAAERLSRFSFTCAFLGADGIAADGTLYTTDAETAHMARIAAAAADKVYILADAGKLARRSFVSFGNLRDSSFALVTDKRADASFVRALQELGAEVMFPDV